MTHKMMALAAAAVATVAIATTAQAGKWVYVPDDGPQTYVYESNRTYVEPDRTYVPAPVERRVYQPVTPEAQSSLYIQTDTAVNDRCTYRRERGLFGGWEETRYCPD